MVKNFNVFILMVVLRGVLVFECGFKQSQFLVDNRLIHCRSVHVKAAGSPRALTHVSLGGFHISIVKVASQPAELFDVIGAYPPWGFLVCGIRHVLDLAVSVE